MQSKNSFSLDLSDNLDLRKLFTGKHVGDKIKLEVDFQLGELSEELVTGTIASVSAMGGDPEDPAEPTVTPSIDNDVITPVSAVVIRKPK